MELFNGIVTNPKTKKTISNALYVIFIIFSTVFVILFAYSYMHQEEYLSYLQGFWQTSETTYMVITGKSILYGEVIDNTFTSIYNTEFTIQSKPNILKWNELELKLNIKTPAKNEFKTIFKQTTVNVSLMPSLGYLIVYDKSDAQTPFIKNNKLSVEYLTQQPFNF